MSRPIVSLNTDGAIINVYVYCETCDTGTSVRSPKGDIITTKCCGKKISINSQDSSNTGELDKSSS